MVDGGCWWWNGFLRGVIRVVDGSWWSMIKVCRELHERKQNVRGVQARAIQPAQSLQKVAFTWHCFYASHGHYLTLFFAWHCYYLRLLCAWHCYYLTRLCAWHCYYTWRCFYLTLLLLDTTSTWHCFYLTLLLLDIAIRLDMALLRIAYAWHCFTWRCVYSALLYLALFLHDTAFTCHYFCLDCQCS